MKTIKAEEIKYRAMGLGAELCGIASAKCFTDAPAGFHPADVLKECKSVIVIAARFPASSLSAASPAAYTFVRHRMVYKVDSISFQIALELENLGTCAVPIPSADPYDYWDADRQHGQGIISLKHAAVRAGLGQMGKNTLLVNDQFGNMLWLGAILIDQELAADQPAAYQACIPDCRICLDACPAKAMNGSRVEQRKCRSISGKSTVGGGLVYACNLCRKLCPNCLGLR